MANLTREIHPKVNNNGTSRDDLIRQRHEAYRALRTATEKLAEATPHGRDFQTDANPDAAREARKIHDARMTALNEMMNAIVNEMHVLLEG